MIHQKRDVFDSTDFFFFTLTLSRAHRITRSTPTTAADDKTRERHGKIKG